MQTLAEGSSAGMGEGCMRQLFLQRLPINVQQALALVPDSSPLESLASIADAMMEVRPPSTSIASSSAVPSDLLDRLNSLTTAVQKLTQRFDALETKTKRRQSGGRSRARSQNPTGADICFYHSRFGESARKCNTPCRFSAGNARTQH